MITRNACSTPGKGLGQRVVEGGAWLTLLKFSVKGIGFVSSLVLARVLNPADFGVLGIALLAISLLEMFSQTGFDSALVQKPGDIVGYLDSAWTVSVLRGVLLGLLIFVAAPFVATFFASPKTRDVLCCLALCPLLTGLNNVGTVFFRKELDFKRIFIFEISGNVAYSVVALTLAFLLRNVWALVFGLLATRVTTVTVSFLIHPYRPRFRFEADKAKELFHFGKWLLGTQAVLFFVNRGDNAFVGKMLGATALGFYAMAYNIAYLAFSEVTVLFFKVMFPAYAKLQDSPEKLQEAYFKTVQLLAFICIPITGSIFVLSQDFTRLFLGEKWLPMVPCLKILALSGALVSIGASAGSLLSGVGKPRIVTQLVSIRLAVMAALIYPFTARWGISGTALSVLIGTLIVEPLEIYMGARESGNSLLALAWEIFVPCCCFLIIVLLFNYVRTTMLVRYDLVHFLVTVPCIGSTFLGLIYFSEISFSYTAFRLIRQNVSRFIIPITDR